MLKSFITMPMRIIIRLIYVIFLIAYGIAMLSPSVSPLRTHIPAFFNLAFGVLYIALVLFLIYFLIYWRKHSIALVIHLLLIAFSADYLTSYFPLNFFGDLKDEKDIRVLTYNIEGFTQKPEGPNATPYAIGVIKKYRPDIICLQETPIFSTEAKTTEWFLKYFPKSEYPYIYPSMHVGIALISKYPISEHHAVKYPSESNGSESYLLDVKGRKLLLINNHLESYSLSMKEKDKYRDFIKDPHPKRMWSQFNEIKSRLSPNMDLRVIAADATRKDVHSSQKKHAPDMTIILGDFNDPPMSFAYTTLREGMKDAFKEVGLGPGITFNENLLPFRIDHVFYQGGLDAVGVEIPWIKNASDHNPVIIDFVLH